MGRLLGIAVLSLALAAAEAQQVLKKMCEIGVGFSFAALSVFRLRRAEAASAVWIPHWHWEPFESQGARAAKRYVNGNLVEREKHHLNLHLNLGVGCAPSCWPIFGFRNLLGARSGHRGQFSVQSDNRFSGRRSGVGSLPRAWRRVGVPVPGAAYLKNYFS